jgi:thymidylate synthase (FAD)
MQRMKINCLDHGFVRLVDSMGSDLSIVRAARVSYDAEWRAGEDSSADEKLIRYLMRNKHTSPFEAVTLTFEVKAPIFVLRQWHRHRTWAYNEVSARYTALPEEFYVPDIDAVGSQSASSKQARDLKPVQHGMAAIDIMRRHNTRAFENYRELLSLNVPRELARSVLPVATYSHMFATVNLHNLFHFLRLRLHEHAQYEIRVYAEAMLQFAKKVAPVAAQAFEESL